MHAILWTVTGKTGASLTFTANIVCGTTAVSTWTNFTGTWDNNFESGETYSGCQMRLYAEQTRDLVAA